MRLIILVLLVSWCPVMASAVELVVPGRHTAAVTSLAFLPDGSLLVSAADDGTIRMWDPAKGRLLRTIQAHAGKIMSMAVSPDGKLVASGGEDRAVRIWSADSGELVGLGLLNGAVSDVAWSPNGKECAAAGGVMVAILDAAAKLPLRKLQDGRSPVQGLAYLPGKHQLVMGTGFRRTLRVVDTSTDQVVGEIKTSEPTMKVHAIGNWVVALSTYSLYLFKGSGLAEAAKMSSKDAISDFDFNGHILLGVGNSQSLSIWDAGGRPGAGPQIGSGVHTAVALSNRGNTVAIGDFSGSIKLVDLSSGKISREMTGRGNLIHQVLFRADQSLLVAGAQGSTTRIWSVGQNEETVELNGPYLDVQAVQWIKRDETLVTSSPQQIIAWDIRRRRIIRETKTATIDGWPVSCHESGLCAWEESGQSSLVVLENVLTGAGHRVLPIEQDTVIALDISPDGKYVAAAVNHPVVRIWSIASGQELTPLPLEHALQSSMDFTLPRTPVRRLYVPSSGMATAVRFSPDGKRLAAGNEHAVHVWNLAQPGNPELLRGHKGRVSFLEFAQPGGGLYSVGEDATLRVWNPAGPKGGRVAAQLTALPVNFSVSPDRRMVSVSIPDGQIEIWDLADSKKLATLAFLGDGGWIVATPTGLFEANEGAWRDALWRLRKSTATVEPIERYFKDYYRPGLVADLLTGEAPVAPAAVESLDRAAPDVTITLLGSTPGSAQLIPGSGIQQTPERARFRIEVRAASRKSGIADLRVTHNGLLVQKWPGALKPIHGGVLTQEIELALFPWENRVSAAAFNLAGVRSAEAVWERPQQGSGYMVPAQTLYVLAIGVGTHQDIRFKLDFPESDVELLARAFGRPESEWQSQSQRMSGWANNLVAQTLRSARQEDVPSRSQIVKLVNKGATRDRILEALRQVVHEARPEDAMLLYFSGHGVAVKDRFYLLPYDSAVDADPRQGLPVDKVQRAASTLISDADLERELQGLNVGHAAIVFDACNSGQALAGAELRGPLHSSGLARLAYEKGIYLLAASESSQPARELKELGHSVLTYALVKEGLLEGKADHQPLDGRIDLREWLAYANARVPGVVADTFLRKSGHAPDPGSVQRPRYAPRRIPETSVLVVSVADKEP